MSWKVFTIVCVLSATALGNDWLPAPSPTLLDGGGHVYSEVHDGAEAVLAEDDKEATVRDSTDEMVEYFADAHAFDSTNSGAVLTSTTTVGNVFLEAAEGGYRGGGYCKWSFTGQVFAGAAAGVHVWGKLTGYAAGEHELMALKTGVAHGVLIANSSETWNQSFDALNGIVVKAYAVGARVTYTWHPSTQTWSRAGQTTKAIIDNGVKRTRLISLDDASYATGFKGLATQLAYDGNITWSSWVMASQDVSYGGSVHVGTNASGEATEAGSGKVVSIISRGHGFVSEQIRDTPLP